MRNWRLATAIKRRLVGSLTADLKHKLDQLQYDLQRSLDDRLTSIDKRLDQLQLGSTNIPNDDGKSNLGSAKSLASNDAQRIAMADIELAEQFSHAWESNAHDYLKRLPDLQSAALRLLPLLNESGKYGISRDLRIRVDKLSDEISCLARQPLFFPEMFHGARILPSGEVSRLSHEEAIHLRASGLLSVQDRIAITTMYQRISRQNRAPLRVVEIGSAVGGGSTRIAGRCVKQSGGVLYCVDPWVGFGYFPFITNMQIFDLETTIVPIRSPSVEAAALFPDGSLDAVFVDGSHIYPDVVADIDAYLPKIRKNGYIFGHDLHDLPSRFDRNELLQVANKNNTVVNHIDPQGRIERVDVHPGVILAVQDRFSDEVELLPGSVVWAKQI